MTRSRFAVRLEDVRLVGSTNLTDAATSVAHAPFWRPLRANEARLDFAAKRRVFEHETAALAEALSDGATAIAGDVTDRVRRIVAGGLDARDVAGLSVSLDVQQRIADAVKGRLRASYGEGRRDGARDAVAVTKPPPGHAWGNLTHQQSSRMAKLCAVGERVLRVDLADGLVGTAAQRFFEAKAFYVTGVLADEMLAKAKVILLNALRAEPTSLPPVDVILANLADVLEAYLPVRDAAGRIVNTAHRIETIARTNSAEAVNEGRWSVFTDPDLEGIVEALEYSAILDDRVRDSHRAWDGVTKPAEWWVGPPDRRPPNGFSCRCLLSPVILDVEITPDDALPGVEVVDAGFK